MPDEDLSGSGLPPDPGEGKQSTEEPDKKASDASAQGEEEDSKEYENALAQCGGDTEELGKRFYKLQNDAAHIAKESAQDRVAFREALKSRPAEKEPDPEPTPDLQRNTRRMEALATNIKDLEAERSDVLSAIADSRGTVRYIEGQVDRADELDKPELQAKLAEAKRTAASSEKEYRKFGAKHRELTDQLGERKDERKDIEAAIKEHRASQRQADEDTQKFQENFPVYIDELIKESADELKIPTTTKVREGLWKAVNSNVAMELQHMREQGEEKVDMPALVKLHVKEFADIHNLADREAFDKESREKRSVQRQPARRQAAAPPDDDEPPKPRWQDVEERAPSMQKAREGMEAKFSEHLQKHGHL